VKFNNNLSKRNRSVSFNNSIKKEKKLIYQSKNLTDEKMCVISPLSVGKFNDKNNDKIKTNFDIFKAVYVHNDK